MTPPARFRPLAQATWGDATWKPGAHLIAGENAVVFAVYAAHATRVLLEIYDAPTGRDAAAEFVMARNADDGFWRARIEVGGGAHGLLYAFRCWGPNWAYDPAWTRGGSLAGFHEDVDGGGCRYNPNKVLFDPYAREISHERTSRALVEAGEDAGMYGTGSGLYRGRPRREVDTGHWAPKGLVICNSTPTGTRPRIPAENAAICEAHVRNLTGHPSTGRLRATLAGIPGFERVPDIPAGLRGTYRAAGLMAPYIRALGFSAIELLPIHETDNGPASAWEGKLNHWGYQTIGFFAPDRDYAHDQSPGGPTREFKEMVRAFHDEGLEVFLDVVYNHTAEGGNWNGDRDTVGFVTLGGFDAPEYYVLTDNQYLVDGATGCSNQLNCSTPATRSLVLDSLRYWIHDMGIDGFRFDLAPVLGRTPNAFERQNWDAQKRFFPDHPLLKAVRDLGESLEVEVIAEAWDLWGNEVGNFPSGWGEWNGRFRDAVREYFRGAGNAQEFMEMVNGDYRHFSDQGGAQKSINFITAHDGFTLLDLVSYDGRNNGGAYPFGPSDGGSDNNRSWDSGGDPALRRQRLRNFWTMLFFSRGVPLAVSGDEFGRTQNGNNNPWNLNTVGIWNNYGMIASHRPTGVPVDPDDPTLHYHDNFGQAYCAPDVNPYFRFAAFVAGLRRDHPALRQRAWGDLIPDNNDVDYLFSRPDGRGDLDPWDRCLRLQIDGSAAGDCDFLLFINMWTEEVEFSVPPAAPGKRWVRIIDTASWAEPACNSWLPGDAEWIPSGYRVHPWSMVVLQEVD